MTKLLIMLLTLLSTIAPRLNVEPEYVGNAVVVEVEQLEENYYWTTILLSDGTKEYLVSDNILYEVNAVLEVIVYDLYVFHTNHTNAYITAGLELYQLK